MLNLKDSLTIREPSLVWQTARNSIEGLDLDFTAYAKLSVMTGDIDHYQKLFDLAFKDSESATGADQPAICAAWRTTSNSASRAASRAGYRLTWPNIKSGVGEVGWVTKETAAKEDKEKAAEKLTNSQKARAAHAARIEADLLAKAQSQTAETLVARLLSDASICGATAVDLVAEILRATGMTPDSLKSAVAQSKSPRLPAIDPTAEPTAVAETAETA